MHDMFLCRHRPMYTSTNGFLASSSNLAEVVEPLLVQNKVSKWSSWDFVYSFIDILVTVDHILRLKQVDLALFGHVHNYERTCSVFQHECKALPTKDKNGVDIYDGRNYSAPVQVVIGMAGFSLDKFPSSVFIPSSYSFILNHLHFIYIYICSELCFLFWTKQSKFMFSCINRRTVGAWKGFLNMVI